MGRYSKLKRFEVHSGGYMGLSFSVEKDGDVLTYKTYGHGYSLETVQKIKPSPEEWKKFWNACDRAGMWEWQARYENSRILDGFSWRILIQFVDKEFDSSGSNDRPDGLNDLLKAVSELLGGVAFC